MSATHGINPLSRSTAAIGGRCITCYPKLKHFVVLFAFCITSFAQENSTVSKDAHRSETINRMAAFSRRSESG